MASSAQQILAQEAALFEREQGLPTGAIASALVQNAGNAAGPLIDALTSAIETELARYGTFDATQLDPIFAQLLSDPSPFLPPDPATFLAAFTVPQQVSGLGAGLHDQNGGAAPDPNDGTWTPLCTPEQLVRKMPDGTQVKMQVIAARRQDGHPIPTDANGCAAAQSS